MKVRTFVKWFVIIEVSFVLLAVVLNEDAFFGLFLLLLVLGPLVGLSVALNSSPGSNIHEVENTGLWLASVISCVAIWLFLLVVKLFWYLGGGLLYTTVFYGLSLLLFVFSAICLYYASANFHEWLRIQKAMRAACPHCGSRSPRKYDVCTKCGAVVVWIPDW